MELQLHSFLTSALDGVNVQLHAPAALPQGKHTGTNSTAGWLGPKACAYVLEKKKIFFPLPGLELRTVQVVEIPDPRPWYSRFPSQRPTT